MNDFEPTN